MTGLWMPTGVGTCERCETEDTLIADIGPKHRPLWICDDCNRAPSTCGDCGGYCPKGALVCKPCGAEQKDQDR